MSIFAVISLSRRFDRILGLIVSRNTDKFTLSRRTGSKPFIIPTQSQSQP